MISIRAASNKLGVEREYVHGLCAGLGLPLTRMGIARMMTIEQFETIAAHCRAHPDLMPRKYKAAQAS